MNRRRFLSLSALSIPLSGCVELGLDDATEQNSPASNATEAPSNTATETGTSSPEAVTPECWPAMCEGSKLVEVQVVGDFSGDVVLKAFCQGKEVAIQPGESVQINRESDGQVCGIYVSVDGEQVFSDRVASHQSLDLNVDSNGEVTAQWIVQ